MREITADDETLGGSPRLEGTRIGVLHIYEQYQAGETPETIAARYDDVSVADIHNALAHVFDNPELIQQRREKRQQTVERIRESRPVDPEEYKKRI